MSTAGVLNDIVRSLEVSVALGGQLIGAAAVVMALGSPLLAGLLSGITGIELVDLLTDRSEKVES